MRYRVLGKTGWEVSAVSMGCWALGDEWGKMTEEQACATVHAALDAGVNLFDTADSYGENGQSEKFLGKALEGRRDGVYIATKVGNRLTWKPGDSSTALIDDIVACCDRSLQRLGIETIDVYQIHNPRPESPEVWVEALEKLIAQGKIRYFGISTNDLNALKSVDIAPGCAVCQIGYSILGRGPESQLFPYCQENGIGVLLKGPIAQGLLADKFTEETVFEDDVRQGWNAGGQQREHLVKSLVKVEKLRPLAREGRSMLEAALQFTLAQPAVTCPIPSMKNPGQVAQNTAAADGDLSAEDLALIDSVCPCPG